MRAAERRQFDWQEVRARCPVVAAAIDRYFDGANLPGGMTLRAYLVGPDWPGSPPVIQLVVDYDQRRSGFVILDESMHLRDPRIQEADVRKRLDRAILAVIRPEQAGEV